MYNTQGVYIHVSILFCYISVKEPNQQHCDSPFNLPIPVKGKTETTTDVHMDPNGTELNSDAVTPDSDTKDESHNDDGNYKTSLKLDPDSDVEDPSSPEITHVAKGKLTKDVVPMNNESQTTGDGNDEPMEISDDEGTEENPIALSDSESAEESTDFLDETKDGHSESQAIPVDNSPSQGGNADETQRIGDGDESQKTTGSSDDSESVPFDLKPSQSPKSILGSVPNIGLRDQNSETDEDRESPSLLQPGPSQTWAETADDQLSPSLLQPGPSQTWVESADDRGSPRLRQPGPPQTWAETADDRGSPSLLQPGPSQTWAQTDDDRGSPSLRQLGPSQTWVSRSESLPDVVLIHSVERIEKKYFETVEATEKRKYSGMKEEFRSPSSDENHDSPIITGSSGLSHSKPGGSKHFKEASKTSGTNLKSRRSKESTIGSNNSASSWSHSAKNNDEVTDAISSFVPREGSLTDDDLLLSLEQFKAHELKHVDHQEDVNSLQEVKSKKKDTNVEDRGLSPNIDMYICVNTFLINSCFFLKIVIDKKAFQCRIQPPIFPSLNRSGGGTWGRGRGS